MNKILILMVSAISVVAMSGCSSLNDPHFVGSISGKASYIAYEKVAEKQPQEFRDKVNALWIEINKIDELSDLKVASALISSKFDEVIAAKNLSKSDVKILTSLKNDICKKIDEIIVSNFESNTNGVEFLIGVRDGVNSMIEVETEE